MTGLRFTILAAAGSALAIAAPAFAQPLIVVTPNPPAAVAPVVAPVTPVADNGRNPNRMICKREVEIGSRLGGVQVCHTRGEWADISRETAKAFADAQMSGMRANVGNSMGAFGK